jgi:hypothetical protein
MPLAEVEERNNVPAGTHEVTVTDIQPDTIVPRMGKDAGKTIPVYRWTLQTDDDYDALDYLTRKDPTSEKSAIFKAFVAIGLTRAQMFSVERGDVVGRMCLATVSINPDGYAHVDALTALPVRRAPAAQPAAQPAATPTEQQAENSTDELPF